MRAARDLETEQGYERRGRVGFQREGVEADGIVIVIVVVVVGMLAWIVAVVPALVDGFGFGTVDARRIQT